MIGKDKGARYGGCLLSATIKSVMLLSTSVVPQSELHAKSISVTEKEGEPFQVKNLEHWRRGEVCVRYLTYLSPGWSA